jgi:excisionase family DNA binding protein
MISETRFLTVTGTANRYSTSKSSIYRHLRAGDIRAVKFGGRTLIDVGSADKFFDGLPEIQLASSKKR